MVRTITIIVVILLTIIWVLWEKILKKDEILNHKFTAFIVAVWIIASLFYGYFMHEDSIHIKNLEDNIQELKNDIRYLSKRDQEQISNLTNTVIKSIDENCIRDISNLADLVKEKHQQTFDSSSKEAERWAAGFQKRLEDYYERREKKYVNMRELSERSLPYFITLTEYILSIFDRTSEELKENNVNIKLISYNYDIRKNNTTISSAPEPVIIKEAVINDSIYIKIIFHHRRITENGIVTHHPKLEFRGRSPRDNDHFFFIKGPDINYQEENHTTGGIRFHRPLYDLTYPLDADPLSDDKFILSIRKNIQKLFEYVYKNYQ